ncbi:predicted protein [Uncinocarpus reesii 1704]|uniref:Uncharacterized protein n=1 Tax=Uncinocarpus reesii (strain UAMH 1704) TaxID=336963 RepID=C4JTU2_UNCRE|nr:uncharacterized protein UREG_05881 [Uncinocarpus reesii 1704]EEP81039.1 predicted protein [Uncinocarpus reesii 1704]
MIEFPTLQPAFSLQPMVGGRVKSLPGFSPAFNGEFVGSGNDYIRVDPDGKHFRLDAHGVIRTDDGAV